MCVCVCVCACGCLFPPVGKCSLYPCKLGTRYLYVFSNVIISSRSITYKHCQQRGSTSVSRGASRRGPARVSRAFPPPACAEPGAASWPDACAAGGRCSAAGAAGALCGPCGYLMPDSWGSANSYVAGGRLLASTRAVLQCRRRQEAVEADLRRPIQRRGQLSGRPNISALQRCTCV